MDQITHRVRAEEWKAIIEQCQARPEGQTAKQWLADNGISDKTSLLRSLSLLWAERSTWMLCRLSVYFCFHCYP